MNTSLIAQARRLDTLSASELDAYIRTAPKGTDRTHYAVCCHAILIGRAEGSPNVWRHEEARNRIYGRLGK